MANFEEIVNSLRRHLTVVNGPSDATNCYSHYGLAGSSADFVIQFHSMLPAGTTHLLVWDDVLLKLLHYRAFNMSAWCDKLEADLRKLYKVKVTVSVEPGMQWMGVCDKWIERFQAKHAHENWTDLILFADTTQARIGYIGHKNLSFNDVVTMLSKRHKVVTIVHVLSAWSSRHISFQEVVQGKLIDGDHLIVMDCGGDLVRYMAADIAKEFNTLVTELRKHYTVQIHEHTLGDCTTEIAHLINNPQEVAMEIYACHPTWTHLDIRCDPQPHGLFVYFKMGVPRTFETVVAELRKRFKVVTVAELPKFPFNVGLAEAHKIELDNVDHLVVWHNNGLVYYNGWLIETQFQKVVNELQQQRYTVHVVSKKKPYHRWTAPITDNVWGPLEMNSNWTEIEIGYEANPDGLSVFYSGAWAYHPERCYKTITLSCSHLAFIDPPVDLNLDRLPHCPCQQPRQYKLQWTQYIKDHKVVYVEVMDKADRTALEQVVCDICKTKYMSDNLRWRRDPRALGQATHALFCTQCYAKAYAEMENYIKTSFVKP